MITQTDLQTIVQFYARDNGLSLAATPNLDMCNVVYRGMVGLLRFGETLQKRDPWATTVALQASIPYPADPQWMDWTAFEIQNPGDSGSYIGVMPYRDENEWNALAASPPGIPTQRRVFGGESLADRTIWFAPTPISALNIRVRGTIEPPPMTASLGDEQWRTVFDSKFKDDILALLIAATLNVNRAQADLAQINAGSALQRLKQLAVWTPQVEEQLRGLIGVMPVGLSNA